MKINYKDLDCTLKEAHLTSNSQIAQLNKLTQAAKYLMSLFGQILLYHHGLNGNNRAIDEMHKNYKKNTKCLNKS